MQTNARIVLTVWQGTFQSLRLNKVDPYANTALRGTATILVTMVREQAALPTLFEPTLVQL